MRYQTNHLDSRILGGLRTVLMPNDVLTEEQVSRFPLQLQGMVGYATECLMDFQNLGINPRSKLFRIVEVKCGSPFPFRCCVADHPNAEGDFSFFLPACQVAAFCDEPEEKEPKGRPFTIVEFEKHFNIGDKLYLRVDKSPRCLVGQVLAYRCIAGDDESLEVLISGLSLCLRSAQWLFEHVEYSVPGDHFDWQPFGVEGV